MGLDLVVEGRAKPGFEAEWQVVVERSFGGDDLTDEEIARFNEISIPAYECVGAPRVGYDSAADAWIIEQKQARTPEEADAVLKDFHGYYVLRLASSDGVPEYSHGGLYDGVDETSFRGAFLGACGDVLGKDLMERAWDNKLPLAAVDYGRALSAAADAAAAAGPPAKPPPPKAGFLSRLVGTRAPPESEPFEDQLKIVRAASRWFIFWGERGHPIRAWF